MKNFIIYDQKGQILRTGSCGDQDFFLQLHNENEFLLEGQAKDSIHKIVDGKIVNKDPEEINSKKRITKKKPAIITEEQLQAILNRLTVLEKLVNG